MNLQLNAKSYYTSIIFFTITMISNTALAIEFSNTTDNATDFFTTNSKLYYEIGGARRFAPVTTNDSSAINLGLSGGANIGYSCGNFDIGASFRNTMNNLKDGVDDVKNTIIGGITGAISSLPLATLQRARPGMYDMFQEMSAEANTKIEVAAKSCEQMEAELANGENPYADFIQVSKSQSWKDKATSEGDIVAAKKEAEKDNGKSGITSFGGEKVGGEGQPPLKVITSSVGAGYNFMLGENDATANKNASPDSELYKVFPTKQSAQQWTTDVVGEFEINNTKPVSKVGLGLHSKLKSEKTAVIELIKDNKWDELGISPAVLTKLADFTADNQATILANIADDLAIKSVINKALTARKILMLGSQDPTESSSSNELTSKQRDKAIAKLDKDIESIIFERKIKQELANETILKVINATKEAPNSETKTEPSKLL